MRTNIDIDDDLIAEAMAATGLTTKKATVEEALRRLVRRHQRLDALADMAGAEHAMRADDERDAVADAVGVPHTGTSRQS